MSKMFYRLRSATNLLDGFNELEKQTIYFAPPEQLNDPMEGYRNVFWSGDIIAWNNLFSHYIFCLQRLTLELLISGEEFQLTANDIPVFDSTEDLPTDKYKNLFSKIKERFLNHSDIVAFMASILKRSTPIRKKELHYYLDCIHLPALKIIYDIYIEEKCSEEGNRVSDSSFDLVREVVNSDFIGKVEESLVTSGSEQSVVAKIFLAQKLYKEQMYLLDKYNGIISKSKPNRNLIVNEFSSRYLDRLEEIAFPKWYTSCFMSECENSSVWGHYGDNHRGMCLIFESEIMDNRPYIKLNGITGLNNSGLTYGKIPMEFHSINYKDGFGEIDFFSSIGVLPINVVSKMWHTDDDKNVSKIANDMRADIDLWRNNHWRDFIRDIKTKSKDWEYENELRLILRGGFTDLSKETERTLTYEFSSLKGIIFGINTKEEDKLKALEIIEKKCLENERDDFKFYQAYYSTIDNCIKKAEMRLIQFPIATK